MVHIMNYISSSSSRLLELEKGGRDASDFYKWQESMKKVFLLLKLYCSVSYFKFLSACDTKFCSVLSCLHCKDHSKSQYSFFGKIFVAVFLVEMFNSIGYASNTTCDITLHNDF